jgi:hypothetical protein
MTTVSRLENRLHKLEAQLQAKEPPYTWAVEVVWTRARVAARVRRRIGEMRGAGEHAADEDARTLLTGDTPEQAAADLKMLERWDRAHPQAITPEPSVRERISAKLETMARRLEAHR